MNKTKSQWQIEEISSEGILLQDNLVPWLAAVA
jgi:hypothetical protein